MSLGLEHAHQKVGLASGNDDSAELTDREGGLVRGEGHLVQDHGLEVAWRAARGRGGVSARPRAAARAARAARSPYTKAGRSRARTLPLGGAAQVHELALRTPPAPPPDRALLSTLANRFTTKRVAMRPRSSLPLEVLLDLTSVPLSHGQHLRDAPPIPGRLPFPQFLHLRLVPPLLLL